MKNKPVPNFLKNKISLTTCIVDTTIKEKNNTLLALVPNSSTTVYISNIFYKLL